MITPRFQVTQNKASITLKIRAPYCCLRELDVSVEENAFVFACQPYYLRLNLPGNIIENDNSRSQFDADSGEFTFVYEKVTPGEDFPDLDYITTLLCTKVEVNEGGRKIDVLATDTDAATVDIEESTEKYGFAMRGGYNITNLDSEFCDVFKLDPHKVKLSERSKLRVWNEKDKFDPDHYLADYLDSEEVLEICSLKNPWVNADLGFTTKELDFLKDLPNIEYNLSPTQIRYCHNSLLEILFAYCYDRRTTFFEGTCESGWTISTISASLSWFDSFTNPKEAIVCAYRRSLVFPFYRSFALCERVFEDLKVLLELGEKFIIKCLIEIYYVFLHGDSGEFILNNLFIKDYILYIMKWDKNSWYDVVEEAVNLKVDKTVIGLNLLQTEASIKCGGDISDVMVNLRLEDSEDSSEEICEVSSPSETTFSECSDSEQSDETSSSDSEESDETSSSGSEESDKTSSSGSEQADETSKLPDMVIQTNKSSDASVTTTAVAVRK